MKKVGILGGTFNPPHLGHLIMANEAFHALQLDEVRFMPNAIAPHKKIDGDPTSDERRKMVEISIKPFPHFKLETIELERGGISYTYDTMVELRKKEPNNEFYFIVGGDMIDRLHTWYNIDELIHLVHFIGLKRPGTLSKTKYNITMIEAPQFDISSSLIRKRLKTGGTLKFLLPDGVEAYIRKEGLYGT